MQLPDANTPIARCDALSRYTQAALRGYGPVFDAPADVTAKLVALAASLGASTDALNVAQDAYRKSVLGLIAVRVGLKLVDLKADEIVRSVKRAADDAGGDVSAAVFPDGITPIIKPVGPAEVDALAALAGRIQAASKWAVKDAQHARIIGVHAEYKAALEGRKAGMAEAASKRALRDAAREDFLDTFAAVAGGVRSTFLRDRPRNEVFFDTVRVNRSVEDATDEPDDPATPPPAASPAHA
jgi:hypothetical protein